MASLSPLQGNLGTRRAAQLLRRVSFRFRPAMVDQLATMQVTAAVDLLLTAPTPYMEQPVYDDITVPGVENTTWLMPTGLPLPAEDFVLRRWVAAWYLSEAIEDPGGMHKMMLFLHQYGVVTATSFGNTHFFDYLRLLRFGALGNWKKFAFKLIFDNCMLQYLNNNSNTAANPQENFAREFLELFTIGKGPQAGPGDYTNFTEEDIVQAAKVFTGVRNQGDRSIVDAETGIPMGRIQTTAHSWVAKQFSNRLQGLLIPAVTVTAQRTPAKVLEELNLFVNRVFDQPETARNFCRRLYRFYVNEKITEEIENDIIIPLSETFRQQNFEIKPVLAQLLSSTHFFGEDGATSIEPIQGGMIKSPLELSYQAITFFGMTLPNGYTNPTGRFRLFSSGVWDRMLLLAGFPLFISTDVAGYPAYYQVPDYSHQWFNSSTMIARYKLPAMLISGRFTIGANPTGQLGIKLDLPTWVRNSGFFVDPSDPYHLVDKLLTYLLPKEVDGDRFNYFYQTIFLDNLPPADWTYEWENYINTNNDAEVKIALERLLTAILYSQEFQTF